MDFPQKLIGSKRGTLFIAILAAVVAGLLVVVYVKRYRDSVSANSAPVTVLVAKSTIPKGTSGQVVAAQGLYTVSTIRQSQLLEGAISDPASLVGHAATADIYAGQQLTTAEFSAAATSIASTLTAHQRVVSIPFDASHGATPDLNVGDHVDVYAGFNITPVGPTGIPVAGGQSRPVLRLVMQDVPVVRITAGGNSGDQISMKVNDIQAAQLAFAADNGKLWLAVRPASGAKASRPNIVTAETLLLGIPPIAVEKALGARH
jgi:Flp pilus assembly protein CpaB